MATAKQNSDFTDAILPIYPLDQAIDWINSNMSPEDVFTEDKLEAWASENGFEKGS